MSKTFTDNEAEYMTQSATHHWLSIDCWTCELRSDKNSYRRPCSVDGTVGDSPTNVLFVTACSMNEYAEKKKTEKNLIVRSGISEAETTNNKRVRSTFCIEAIQTRSSARPLCDSRASCSVKGHSNLVVTCPAAVLDIPKSNATVGSCVLIA